MLTVTISQGHCCPLMYLLVPNRQIELIELNKIFYILITIFLVIDTEYIFMILAKDWQISPLCILVSVKYICVCMCVCMLIQMHKYHLYFMTSEHFLEFKTTTLEGYLH